MSRGTPSLDIRRARPDDDAQVLELIRASLGWRAEDPNEELFRWKHRDNPFGPSPAWVAVHGSRVVGFRTFMRWEFVDDTGAVIPAVRAVDTATHPDYRGLGIFRTLTLAALEELAEEGVAFVFNTPNDQSRPGYLKMGWSVVGRLPVAFRPAGVSGVARMSRARAPADLWSLPTSAGLSASTALADGALAEHLLPHGPSAGFRTRRSPEYLAWRTSLPSLHYRLMLAHDREGGLVFRVRRRGTAVEAAITELLVSKSAVARRLIRRAVSETAADYGVAIGLRTPQGMLRTPGVGPLLTARSLTRSAPTREDWSLTLGDVELF